MGIIRNYINIEGITPEEKLSKNKKGHTIIYSDVETIFVPINKPGIKSIYEITKEIETTSYRAVLTPLGKVIVLDGIKKYKIIYTENTDLEKVSVIHLQTPFNTFTELPQGLDNIWDIKVHTIDAYFKLIDTRKVYGHFLYLLNVNYEKSNNLDSLTLNYDSNGGNEKSIKADPLKNMFEEISISEEVEKKHEEDTLLDIDEEIL